MFIIHSHHHGEIYVSRSRLAAPTKIREPFRGLVHMELRDARLIQRPSHFLPFVWWVFSSFKPPLSLPTCVVPDPPGLVGNVFAREWVSKLTLRIITPKEVSSLSSFGHLSFCSSLLSFILYTVFNLQDREADKSQGPVHST